MVRLVTESVHNGRAVEAESIPSPSFPHDFPFPKQQTSDTMQSTTVGQPTRKTALPQEYSAQIHDWDLTLAAAAELTKTGHASGRERVYRYFVISDDCRPNKTKKYEEKITKKIQK